MLLAVMADAGAFGRPVRRVHDDQAGNRSAPTLRSKSCFPFSMPGHVAIVADEGGFYGLITRVDVLSYLRRRRQAH